MELDSVKIGRDSGGAGDNSNNDGAVESISRKGLLTNVLCGDFIKVAYPFME